MHFSTRVVLPAALVLLVAAALLGTADRSAAETAKAPRLTTFGSCGQLLTYAKSNAGRFVGPYGLGGQVGIAETTRAGAPAPPLCTQAGRRLLRHERAGGGRRRARHRQDGRQHALRGREREAERGRRQRPEAAPARHARAQPGPEPRAAAARRPAARPLARRLLDRAAAGDRRPDRALAAGAVGAHRGERVRSEAAPPRPHAHARRLLRRRAARRRQRPHRRLVAGAGPAAVRAAEVRDEGGRRRRDPAQPRRRRSLPASRTGCRPTGSGEPDTRPGSRTRSSSAATSAGRSASRASAC